MREKILRFLSDHRGQTVSGQALSERFRISRVAVWKHIQKLRELGYHITSSGRGYRLQQAKDTPFPWSFGGGAFAVHYFEELPSTMEKAKSLAKAGCPDFTVVIAGRQFKGRGRLQRTWHSAPGGLYFTLVLRPRISPMAMSRVTFAASICLARTLYRSYDIDVSVKWPNDLLIAEKKIAGMLCEMEVVDDRVDFLNIGIGLNVNNDPSELENSATSLCRVVGRELDRREILSRFLSDFRSELDQRSLDHIIGEWKNWCGTLNRSVRIVTHREIIEGEAVDVDESGALVLILSGGERRRVFLGDCFHQAG